MSTKRPTFSENWYRVSDLRPRLRASVRVYRQHFRGEQWHVLEDPAANQYFRVGDAGYRFIGLLDGRRTIAEAWSASCEQLGDDAPTQGEAIQLLGNLYSSNLLQGDIPGDTEALFRRHKKRIAREVKGTLASFLFLRIPLWDPDRFLKRWLPIFGPAFSWPGFAVWLILIGAALFNIAGRADELIAGAGGVLGPSNLPLLYGAFILTKVIHELGHGFACKRFGKVQGSGGEVHALGVMLLVLMPVPYVDASSAWALRNKWHRIVIGAAGMYAELAVAAIAAIVWANTGEHTVLNALAYNTIFIAGVSTLLFNANPLLRYDGYYMLSDWLEIPNLAQRSRDFLYHLVRKYLYGVRDSIDPSHTPGERPLLAIYGVLAAIYRVFIFAAIILFIADQLFILGVALAVAALVMIAVVPPLKLTRYLATSPQLSRTRPRAILSTLAALAGLVALIGLVPIPDRARVEGVAEPARFAEVFMPADGFIDAALPDGTLAAPTTAPLLTAHNPSLETDRARAAARLAAARARYRKSLAEDPAAAQAELETITVLEGRLADLESQLASLAIAPPFEGRWIAPDAERLPGAYLRRGERIGVLVSDNDVIIRAVARQPVAALLIAEADRAVEIRPKGRPDMLLTGAADDPRPAGTLRLPSAALGYMVGGQTPTAQDDDSGTRATEPFFEVRITPDNPAALRAGQRVIVRFDMPAKPIAVQALRAVRQMFQERFSIAI